MQPHIAYSLVGAGNTDRQWLRIGRELQARVSTGPDESLLLGDVERVFRVAYRLTGNRADAEDLVQDVCEAALRKAPELATAQDCRRWLLRVLYNRFVDGKRHARRSPLVAEEAAGEADAALAAE